MKQLKFVILIVATLALLISGQSVAVAAVYNETGTSSIEPKDYKSTPSSFSITVEFVGTSSFAEDEISIDSDQSYHVVSSDADILGGALLKIKLNMTGYTCWGSDCSTATLEDRHGKDAYFTVGQPYVIINGAIAQMEVADFGANGNDIFFDKGMNVVTFLYAGKDETGGFVWAQETIWVQVATSSADFIDPVTESIALTTDITDLAASTTTLTGNFVTLGGFGWDKDPIFGPELSSWSFSDGTTTHDDTEVNTLVLDANSELAIEATVNSSGFDGYMNETTQTAIPGHIFVYDAMGLKYLGDNPNTIDIFKTEIPAGAGGGDTVTAQVTPAGLAVLAEYGRWDAAFNGSDNNVIDFERIDSLTNYTVANVTSGEIDGGALPLNASMDFEAATTNSFIVDQPSVTNTGTITTTGDPITTNKTESPGFGALLALLSLGVIAFATPRIRSEKRVHRDK